MARRIKLSLCWSVLVYPVPVVPPTTYLKQTTAKELDQHVGSAMGSHVAPRRKVRIVVSQWLDRSTGEPIVNPVGTAPAAGLTIFRASYGVMYQVRFGVQCSICVPHTCCDRLGS